MWRLLSLVLLALLLSASAFGQFTTVSGTITDTPDGQAWFNGTYSFVFRVSPSNPSAQYFFNGAPFSSAQTIAGALDGSGHYSVSVPSNTSITPAGSTWDLTVCPLASSPCLTVRSITITGGTQTVAPVPPSIRINMGSPPLNTIAYADAELVAGTLGQQYFNATLITTRVCNSLPCGWVPIGGGSGGAILKTNGVPNTVQSILNLLNGTGISFSADGVGGVTATNTAPLQSSCGALGTIQEAGTSGGCNPAPIVDVGGAGTELQTTTQHEFKGPNPEVDVQLFKARAVPVNDGAPYNGPGVNAACINGNATIALTGSGNTRFQNGDGIVLSLCGLAHSMSTPAAPTVTPAIALTNTHTGWVVTNNSAGSVNNRFYVIVGRDLAQGLTAKSAEVAVTGGSTILGSDPISMTSCSRSGQTVTCLTSAHTLPVGCTAGSCGAGFIDSTISDNANFGGWFPLNSVPDSTHFTYIGGLSSANGATTSATGGTFTYFNSDHLVFPAFGAGMWQYGIYEGASGAETLVGVSQVNVPALVGTPTYLTWDYYGSTYSGNSQLPAFWPSTPPSVATNDSLVTTVVSGGGTSTLVVAAAPSNTTTGTALFDDCPTVQAANNFANSFSGGGGITALPAVPAAAGAMSYVFNSSCLLTGNISQSMPLNLYDTMRFHGKWTGERNPNGLYEVAVAFGIEPHIPINVRTANPGIFFTGGSMRGTSIIPFGNNYVAMFYSSIGTSIFENMACGANSANDYNGVCFHDLETANPNSFGWTMNNFTFISGPGQVAGSSFTPLLIRQNNFETHLNNTPMCCRGMFFQPFAAGEMLTVNRRQEIQGATEPEYSFYYGASGVVSGWAEFSNTLPDTTSQPTVTNFTNGPTNTLGIQLSINGANIAQGSAPLLSGAPFASVVLKNVTAATSQLGQNINLHVDGDTSGNQILYTTAILGPSNSLFTNTTPPAAATCSTATAGPPFTQAFASSTFTYAAVFFGGGTGTRSLPSNSCSANGTMQQATLTIPAAIPGAIGYLAYKSGFGFSFLSSTCGTPTTTLATLLGQNCGNSAPAFATGGPSGIGGLNAWTDIFNLFGYEDAQEIAAPPNPAPGFERRYPSSLTHQIACLTSSGASCAASGGAVASPSLSVQFNNSGVPGGIPVPTSPNGVAQSFVSTPAGGVGVVAGFHLPGVVPRVTVCPSNLDTVLATDRAGLVQWNDASACAVTLPQAGSGATTNNDFTNNFVFLSCDIGAGTATVTPTISTITYLSGGVVHSAQTTMPVATGQCAFTYSDNTNYFAIVIAATGVTSFTGDSLVYSNSGSTGPVTLTLNTQTANKVFANCTGGTAAPTFCSIVNAMLPGTGATTVNGQSCALGSTCTLPPGTITVANAGTTGTTVNTLTKLVGAPSTAVITATTDTSGVVGITTSGAGTAGSAVIQLLGSVSCVFDGATIAGDYVQISTTTVGNCHDTNSATYPAPGTGDVIGRVLSTNGGAGTYVLDLFPQEINVSVISVLPNGTTATTQSAGDSTAKVATDSFVTTAVNNAIAAVNPAVAVLAATVGSNLTGTYSNGASGIGATFTITATGAFTLDGVAINTIGQRVLLKDQTSGFQNGVYLATIVGTTGISPVFTRALDYDQPSDINSTGAIPVQSGTVNISTSWLLTSTVNTVGTDALTFVQFSIAPTTLVTAASNFVNGNLVQGAGANKTTSDSGIATANVVTQTSNAASGQVCTYTGTNKVCVPATALPNGITATTQTAASNDTKVATDAYVDGHFIANGTAVMGTSAISSGACATVVTVSATGVATTDVITVGFNTDPTAITGYGASATGAVLTIYPYPTTNNANFKVCNSSAASITPGALTLNWKVVR